MKAIFFVCMLVIIGLGCSNGRISNKRDLSGNKFDNADIVDKVFLFGPSLDSARYKIEADCDCCTSNLALMKDSTFVFISYCLEGDNYRRGKFSVRGKELSLHFDSLSVTQSFGFIADTSYEVSKVAPRNSFIRINSYKSKPLLLTLENGEIEYGIQEEGNSYDKLVKRLPLDTFWRN